TLVLFFFQAEDGIRDFHVTGVQTCALPILESGSIAREPATVEQLEQEGDLAADFIEELLDIADIDGDLALDVRGGRAYVSVEARSEERRVGKECRCRWATGDHRARESGTGT